MDEGHAAAGNGGARRWRFKVAIASLLLWRLAAASCLGGNIEIEERRRLEALCQRQLFGDAEQYCRQKMGDGSLDARLRTFYAIELSRCLVRQAMAATGPEAESLWQSARDAADNFARQKLPAPRLLLLRTQSALVQLSRAQRLASSAELTANVRQRREAMDELRRAATILSELNKQAGIETRRKPVNRRDDRLRPDELRSLINQIHYHQAAAYRSLAALEPPDTPDRADALNQAASLLKPLTALGDDQTLAWESRLDLLATQRLQGRLVEARQLLDKLQSDQAAPEVRLRLRAEAIRLALAARDVAIANELADAGRDIDGRTAPELDDALLETALAEWQAALEKNDEETARACRRKADSLVEQIGHDHGDDWRARAEMRLARLMTKAGGASDVAELERSARTYYQSGQIDAARDAYERGAAAAEKRGEAEKAFELAFLAATLEHERRHFDEAAKRYRELALRWPKNARAAEAHLLAAHDQLEHARGQEESALAAYRAVLEEHIQLFAQSPTASEAQWRLGRVREHEKNWLAAIDAYRAVQRENAKAADAIESTVRCYGKLFAELRKQHQDTRAQAVEAARYFERLAEPRGEPSQAAPEEIRVLAPIAAAKMWLMQGDGGPTAERLLSQLLANSQLSAERRGEAEMLLVAALAAEGDAVRASQQAAKLADLPVAQLYAGVRAFAGELSTTPCDEQAANARFALLVTDQLQRRLSEFPEARRRDCQLWQALALATLGKRQEAIERLAIVVKEHPRDLRALEAHAQVLSQGEQRQILTEAAEAWRKLEQANPPGSARWFAARLELIRLYQRGGGDEEARKILKSTELLHPDLGGGEMRARFEALRGELGVSGSGR